MDFSPYRTTTGILRIMEIITERCKEWNSIQSKDFSGVIALAGVICSFDHLNDRDDAIRAGLERVDSPIALRRWSLEAL